MTILKPLRSGRILSEAEALADLETITTRNTTNHSNSTPTIEPVATQQSDYVHIPGSAFSRELIEHYKAPELNFNFENGLYVAKKRIQKTNPIIEAGRKLGFDLSARAENCGFLGQINWHEAKQIVEQGLQGRILTPALYFPVLKWAEANNTDLAKDLVNYAEWLDAVTKEGAKNQKARFLVHTDKDLNGGKDYGKVVLAEDKYFDYEDIDTNSGLPKILKDTSKFKQWYPENSPTAAFRNRNDSGPILNLSRVPGLACELLGVRVAKIFPR